VKYLFDTDHIIILQRRTGQEFANVIARAARYSPADRGFSIVSLHEQVLGAHAYINRARTMLEIIKGYQMVQENLQSFCTAPVLPFDAAAAAIFDNLRAQRVRIATMDLRIAAALSRGLILLTRNIRDFGKVPGLVTEDWTL
jgi:tRNA(fMet)-specific endonuclease VapC